MTKFNRPIPAKVETLIADIAERILGFETLETRNRDCLDFHEVSCSAVRAALAEAYLAGMFDGRKQAATEAA